MRECIDLQGNALLEIRGVFRENKISHLVGWFLGGPSQARLGSGTHSNIVASLEEEKPTGR